MPMNDITEKIFYTNNDNDNQRMIISTLVDNPVVWQVSKVETFLMGQSGLQRLTFAQKVFDKTTDYVDMNATFPDGSKDFYAMYANYFDSTSAPPDKPYEPIVPINKVRCIYSASTTTIKVGGSYKTVTVNFVDVKGNDVTSDYLDKIQPTNWHCYIDGALADSLVTFLPQTESNKMKVKFNGGRDYISKQLNIILEFPGDTTLDNEPISFEITT